MASSSIDLDALHDLHDLAGQDVIELLALARSTGLQVHRRSFVRAVFATIEIVTHVLKQRIINRPRVPGPPYSAAEWALLSEEAYTLDNKSQAQTRPLFLPVAENWRFAVSLFGRNTGSTFSLDVSGPGWQDLRTAVDVRNRIVHPKALADMSISDAEMDTVLRAYHFISATSVQAALDAIQALQARKGQREADTPSSAKGKPPDGKVGG